MLPSNTDLAWKRFGELDPYYGVCSQERFRRENLGTAARAEFFRSGEEHVHFVFEVLRRHFCPDFQPARVLDFGCGVGRLSLPLAQRCGHVVGVDVSEAMLQEADRNCREQGLGNFEPLCSDDRLCEVGGPFDLIHSLIVFQHIPPRRGLRILRGLLNLLAEGGVGALHFTYARRAPFLMKAAHWLRRWLPLVNGVVNLCQGRPFPYPMMLMNHYDLGRICDLLQENGCGETFVHFTDHGGHRGAVFFFRKQRR